jgi:hypothetical protein
MGLKDKFLKAKCATGLHGGEWAQIAAGSCDEQRACPICESVSTRTKHYLGDWTQTADPAAPKCQFQRNCSRCPQVDTKIEHDSQLEYVNDRPPESGWTAVGRVLGGRAERCRQRYVCTRCGDTNGKTFIQHRWGNGKFFLDEYDRRKVAYLCLVCGTEEIKNAL